LQFGHGWAAVDEQHSRIKVDERDGGLQFGHGWAAVDEPVLDYLYGWFTDGFNSATAGRPWMSLTGGWVLILPMDRGFNSATAGRPWMSAPKPRVYVLGPDASIRPRLGGRG